MSDDRANVENCPVIELTVCGEHVCMLDFQG